MGKLGVAEETRDGVGERGGVTDELCKRNYLCRQMLCDNKRRQKILLWGLDTDWARSYDIFWWKVH